MAKGINDAIADLQLARMQLEALDKAAPRIVGVEAVKWIQGNFAKQGYKGRRWKKRSPATNKRYDSRSGVKGSVFSSGAPVLDQTGNLKDGVRARVEGRRVHLGFNTDKIPYGVIHNEGGVINIPPKKKTVAFLGNRFAKRGTGTNRELNYKAHKINMPQRQFMPKPNEAEDPQLMKAVTSKINYEREKIMRKFKK